ncbi:MAG: benzoate-CoA ligase family protein [Desulfobacula sp.]|uniref:benzoate-CoA ligase family protein n=1 Tax=Desulfobacula sp. TaxID=2593537 RepID=UPI0025C23FB1|nr:benzoate-CoA ligase family protein [Desulfobacula sp.]MCD4720870.1 benzoate-CoA ligase family protein [Desulfobacula sp.]
MKLNVLQSEYFNAADYFVDRNIREGRKDKVAVLCEDRQMTYGRLEKEVNRFGNSLLSSGIRLEDRVAMLMLDTEFYPVVFFGSIKAGAVPICLNTLMRSKDYSYFLNDSRARVLVVDEALYPNIEEIKTELKFLERIIIVNGDQNVTGTTGYDAFVCDQPDSLDPAQTCPDDACFWLYSSGSTGKPKGTVHLQHDMLFSVETYGKQVLKVKEDDICFSAAKLFFAYGLGNGLYFPFSVGATTVLMPERPTPESVYRTIALHQPSLFFGVPTLYGAMLAEEGKVNGVRLCISAGEALPADIFYRWKDRFNLDILDGIGSTEIVHIYISNRVDEIRPGSTGQLVPGYEGKVVDDDFNELPQGEVGTVLIKGDSTAAYYWNKHDKTKEAMMGEWFNTDDKFFVDEEGFYYYVGRSNDMLKVGGIWVSPIEVEACLIGHPSVLECAVVPGRDEENLVKPCAYIVLNKDFSPSDELEKEIKTYVKKELAHYKYPRWIYFVEDLPKTPTGKIKRFELKDLEEQKMLSA